MRTLALVPLLAVTLTTTAWCSGFTVDHTTTDLSAIPDEYITNAKSDLHIVYTHTSHGSQLVSGMDGLKNYPSFGSRYRWQDSSLGDETALSLDDRASQQPEPDLSLGDNDADNDGIADWAEYTADFLNLAENNHVNVIMWSWCDIAGHDIDRYLRSMEWLISEFGENGSRDRAAQSPVQFVFMTGHANGGGENDSSDSQNRKIREHCQVQDRILFDFADIENYDPDGNYFLNKRLDDALYYDSDENGSRESNWASEYLGRHDGGELDRLTTGEGIDGYDGIGSCAHSPGGGETPDARLNCILKGRASWYLFARLAGWKTDETSDDPVDPGSTPPEQQQVSGIGSAPARLLLLQLDASE